MQILLNANNAQCKYYSMQILFNAIVFNANIIQCKYYSMQYYSMQYYSMHIYPGEGNRINYYHAPDIDIYFQKRIIYIPTLSKLIYNYGI